MWFDARAKLDEIEGRSTATIATIATNRTIRDPSVAEVAIVAAPVSARAGASFASGQNAVDFAPNPDTFPRRSPEAPRCAIVAGMGRSLPSLLGVDLTVGSVITRGRNSGSPLPRPGNETNPRNALPDESST